MLKAMLINRIVVLMLIMVLIPNLMSAIAQENDSSNLGKTTELIVVDSRPSGAIVQINGIYKFTGRTPYVVPYPLRGRYKIKATKAGYESETSHMSFVGHGESNILIKLKAKNRFKAAYRSLLFPGWGQIYGGDKLRGVIISTAQIVLGIRTVFAIHDYNKSQDELDRALEIFNRRLDETSFQDVQDKLIKAEDDHNFRNTFLIITASFWAYNVLDSFLFFSPKGTQIEIKTNPLSHNFRDERLMLTWKIGL